MKLSTLLALSILLTGCSTTPPAAVGFSQLTTKEKQLIATTPVIDIHTHTFNSTFLPIEQIALGKRDVLGHFSFFTGDHTTKAFSNSITRWTAKREKISNEDSPTGTESSDPIVDKLMEREDAPHELTAAELRQLESASAPYVSPGGLLSLLSVFGAVTHNHELEHFTYCLTTPKSEMVARYQSDHAGKISLSASQMMDMAPTYNQPEDNSKLLPVTRQIQEMKKQQANAKGRLLYFVGYNPFRDHWRGDPNAGPGHSLAIVKEAYEKQGAFGVKVYPPSGYAPAGTSIKFRPWAISRQPGEQWDARYMVNGTKITPQELDQRLDALFTWAEKNNVPVFTHCGQGEFQARNGYYSYADPTGWKLVLEKHPDLILCLGHAGGGSEWYSRNPLNGWGKTVFELCRDYPNVYCEFGCQDAIADPAKRLAFTAQLTKLIEESKTSSKPWDFSKKILYGTDWFMPMPASSDRLNHLRAHQLAITEAGGSELYKKYFYRNALTYLQPEKRIAKGGLPGPLVNHLRQLLAAE